METSESRARQSLCLLSATRLGGAQAKLSNGNCLPWILSPIEVPCQGAVTTAPTTGHRGWSMASTRRLCSCMAWQANQPSECSSQFANAPANDVLPPVVRIAPCLCQDLKF